MRVSDAIELKVGDVQRELELEKVPLANQGYDCQQIGNKKWLMRKKLSK
ncbi:MAG: hypothetical protein ACP5IJ_02940 [Candidatus Nanoarchaeia archaeon]